MPAETSTLVIAKFIHKAFFQEERSEKRYLLRMLERNRRADGFTKSSKMTDRVPTKNIT